MRFFQGRYTHSGPQVIIPQDGRERFFRLGIQLKEQTDPSVLQEFLLAGVIIKYAVWLTEGNENDGIDIIGTS